MSIIYSYPEQGTLNSGDMLIGTSVEKVGGKQKNVTKNFSIQQIADFINRGAGLIDPVATDFQIPVFNQGGLKITGSIMSQNSSPSNGVAGTIITIAGSQLTTIDSTINRNLSVLGDTTLGVNSTDNVILNGVTSLLGPIKDGANTLGQTNQILISNNAGLLTWNDYSAGLTYQGVWNATTNTPQLAPGTGTNGHFYIVSVAGNINLDGNTDWQVGDWALFTGTQGAGGFWDKIDNTQSLTGSGTTNTMTMWTSPSAIGDSLISQAGTVVSVAGFLRVDDTIESTTANTNLKIQGNGTGAVEVRGFGGVTGQAGRIQFNCSNNNHGVSIQGPPHSAAQNYTLTLPVNVGISGDVLTTDSAGTPSQLSWSTPTVGTVTSINYTTDFTAFTAGPGTAITTAGVFTLNKNGGTTGQYIDGAAGAWVDLPTDDTYDIGSSTDGANVRLNLDAASGADSFVTLAGSGLTIAQTNDIVTFTVPAAATVVDTFTNANGTYVSAATVNTNATGNVTTGIIDLSAVDGTSDSTTKFLSKDNTWDVPSYTTNTDTTYNLSAGVLGSNSIPLKLDATPGTDSAVNLTGGTGITLARTSGTEITITGSAQGVTSVSGTANRISVAGGNTAVVNAVTGVVNSASVTLATGQQIQTAIDSALSGALTFKGTFNAATGLILSGVNNTLYLYNCPGGAGTRVAISIGDLYIASTAGAFYCDSASQYALNIGDEVIATAAAAADASVKTGWSVVPSTGGLTGSGTTNFVPKFTSATGLSDSLIFDNGTNVGIGTTTPASVLHLKSTVNNATQLIFENTNNGSNIDIDFYNNVNAVQSRIRYSESSGGFDFIPNTTTGSSALFISYGGNVGINVTDPDAQLEIVNSLGGSYRLGYSGTDSYFDSENFYIRSGSGGANKVIVNSSGNVGIGLIAPLSKLHVKGGSTTTQATAAAFIANSTARFVTTSSNDYGAYIGYANATNDAVAIQSAKANATVHPLALNPYGANVGIGTTTPDQKLHVKAALSSSAIARIESITGGQNAQIEFKILNLSTIWAIGSNISLPNTGTLEFSLSGSPQVVMTTTGKVGIGTTTPDALLNVESSNVDTAIIRLGCTRDATWALGNILGSLDFFSADTSGAGVGLRGSVSMKAETTDGGSMGMAFATYNNSEKMRIAATGNVGIGSNAPGSKLTLQGNTNSYVQAPVIRFDSTATQANVRNWGIGPADSEYGNFHIYKSGAIGNNPITGAGAKTFTIDYQGNVGIGTDIPGALLQVQAVDGVTGAIEVKGGPINGAVGTINSELNFGANDSSVIGGLGGSIKSVNETTNGAYAGMSFYTYRQNRPPGPPYNTDLKEAMRITNLGGISFGSTGTAYGSPGQVLTSNADAPPTWQGGGSGAVLTKKLFASLSSATTAFALTSGINPVDINYVNIFIDGVYQNSGSYSIAQAGAVTTVTLSVAAPVGTSVEIVSTT